MGKLLTAVVNLLFPPRPHEVVIQALNDSDVTALFQPGNFTGVTYLARYTDPKVQACIVENKFQHNRKAAKILGQLLKQWIQSERKKTLFIPVPLGKKRERERMHNQTLSILKQAGSGMHISTSLLKRLKETPPQTQLNRFDRIKNIKGAFVCNDNNIDWDKYEQVVIIDDVVTTGATLLAAQTALTKNIPPHIVIRTVAISH